MERKVPAVRFVRCPKCLKILTELAEVPVYKCGGCGTVLRAKTWSNNGVNLSSLPAIPASQTLPNSDLLNSELKNHKQKAYAPDVSKLADQAEATNPNASYDTTCKEKSLEHEKDDIKKFIIPSLTDEAKSDLEGGAFIKESFEEGIKQDQFYHVVNPESFDSLDKLDESSKFHCASSDKNLKKMELGNDDFFLASRSPFHAYDGSASSTDEDRKGSMLRLSKRTVRNKNVLNSINSANAGENLVRRLSNDRFHSVRSVKLKSSDDSCRTEEGSLFTSQLARRSSIGSVINDFSNYSINDYEDGISYRFLEHNNQAKILNQVNELRNELRGMFSDAVDLKDLSLFARKPFQFTRKVPSKELRSSLFPFHRKPNSSYFQSSTNCKCTHDQQCRPCPHNGCYHLSEPAIQPFQKQYSTIHHEPPDLQFKFSKPQIGFRLCRPVSGGAPFITCYKCFNLLQLPMDFLVSPKRVNKLRCGSCSQVLMYGFGPINSSLNEQCDGFNAVVDNFAVCHKKATFWDPVSSSDSNSSEEVKKQVDNDDFRGTRLHSLMGYYSVSELLFSNGCFPDDYQSTESSMERIYRASERKKIGTGSERN